MSRVTPAAAAAFAAAWQPPPLGGDDPLDAAADAAAPDGEANVDAVAGSDGEGDDADGARSDGCSLAPARKVS